MQLLAPFGVAVGLGLMLLAAPAATQTSVETSTTTFVILAADAPEGELTAGPDEPLLRQKIASTRAARLDEAATTALGWALDKEFPAGTKMFGVRVPDGWIYCAVAESTMGWLYADQFACYQDLDDDGRFDVVRPSGMPFNGVPLFVFQPGPAKPLPTPVRYSTLNYRDGPTTDYGIVWEPVGKKPRKGDPPLISSRINWKVAALLPNGRKVELTSPTPLTMPIPGQSFSIYQDGATITVMGFNPDGRIRYRVDRTMHPQVQPIVMTLTTSNYYYVVAY